MAQYTDKMVETIDEVFRQMGHLYPMTPFEVVFWDGILRKYGEGEAKFKITVRRQESIKNVLSAGSLGFGQEYAKGAVRVDGDLQELLKMADYWSRSVFKLSIGSKLKILYNHLAARPNAHNAAKNAKHHYDIGNQFYSLWLDPTMTYSCAYFKDANDSLETAQNNKYEHLCRKLQLKAGESLVDIGCGWGGMMFYAAKNYGAKCAGYTLAKNQQAYILDKIKKEGLEDRVAVYLKDYRKAEGVFDKFVSVGMFEHVGRPYYAKFFQAVKRILRPRGIGVMHNIGTTGEGGTDPWIDKYIFPGGHIPTLPDQIGEMNAAGFISYDIEDLRPHYAKTLDLWIGNFENRSEQIKKIAAIERRDEAKAEEFVRIWRLYLNASCVSFKAGANRLYQITFSNGINDDLPLTRDYLYRQ